MSRFVWNPGAPSFVFLAKGWDFDSSGPNPDRHRRFSSHRCASFYGIVALLFSAFAKADLSLSVPFFAYFAIPRQSSPRDGPLSDGSQRVPSLLL